MRYHVTYWVAPHPEGLDASEVPKGQGACSAVLIGSLLYPDDGSYSAAFVSVDGRTGAPLDDAEIWKAWVMLAKPLGESTTLASHKRELSRLVFEAVVAHMAAVDGSPE